MKRLILSLSLSLGLVGLLVSGCDRKFTSEPEDSVPVEASLRITTANEVFSLPADGISTLEIRAEIPRGLLKADRKARFETSGGKFVQNGSDQSTSNVSFDAGGSAVAVLRSSTTPEPVVVTVTVVDGTTPTVTGPSARLTLEFVVPDGNSMRFVRARSKVAGDGATATLFAVEVPQSLALDQRNVVFETTIGSFDGANDRMETVPAGADGVANILLVSPSRLGFGTLSATVGIFRVEAVIESVRAFPESIRLEAPAAVKQKATASVKAVLVRSSGVPSEGTLVDFTAKDSTGAVFGAFRNVTLSDSKGVVTAEFQPGETGTIGAATMEARVEGTSVVGITRFVLEEAD